MEQNTKRILNQKTILDQFRIPSKHQKADVRLYFGLAVLFAVMCAVGVLLGMSWQAAGLLYIGILALFLIIGIVFLIRARKIKNLEYYITENTCINKNIILDTEPRGIDDPTLPDDRYYLFMDPYCVIDSQYFYEHTEIGDRFYLLHSNNNQVLALFKQTAWTLDTSEFTEVEEGYYFPN